MEWRVESLEVVSQVEVEQVGRAVEMEGEEILLHPGSWAVH